MNNDPVQLSKKITQYIFSAGIPVSYELIEERAKGHNVPQGILDNAMAILHRNKKIDKKVVNDSIVYSVKEVKEKTMATPSQWLRDNYPWIDDFIMPFPEINMSHIFLKPEELKAYKAQLRGVAYIPTRRYERK
jgi:hypothetical protein